MIVDPQLRADIEMYVRFAIIDGTEAKPETELEPLVNHRTNQIVDCVERADAGF